MVFGLFSVVGFFVVGGWMLQRDNLPLALGCFAIGVLNALWRLGLLTGS